MPSGVSAIVRTYNSAATLDACLDSLRAQRETVEIVVVDSGSTDRTLQIAGRRADAVVTIPHEQFTYGRALNLGASTATGSIHVALSSHCVLPDKGWVTTAAGHLSDEKVAATTGRTFAPDGSPISQPIRVTSETPLPNPFWSFSNHACAWRRDVWERFAFDEALEAGEDTDWSDRVVAAGFTIVFDPALHVSDHHRRTQGLVALYQRRKRETRALARVRDGVVLTTPQLLAKWWRTPPMWDSALKARLSPHRLTSLSAEWVVGREVRAARRTGVLERPTPGAHPDRATGPER